MTTAISVSEKTDEIWTIQDRVFRWFALLISDQHQGDAEVIAQLELASAMNGVSLDGLAADNPELSNRLASAFRMMAQEIADGAIKVPDDVCESTDRCSELFGKLAQILLAFECRMSSTS